MHQVRSGEHWIDAGPTVFTMRWVFDDLFANAGAQFASRLPFKEITTLARHWWTSGASIDLHADPQVTAADIAALAGSEDAEGYLQLCRDSGHIFELLKTSFMAAPQPNPISLAMRIGLNKLGEMLTLRPHQTLWRALGDYLKDPRLRQLFGRYATYVGSSPFRAPATLLLITHAEQQGVWVLPGGMTSLARAMQNLAEEHGAQFRLNTVALVASPSTTANHWKPTMSSSMVTEVPWQQAVWAPMLFWQPEGPPWRKEVYLPLPGVCGQILLGFH
jgi:1-hydroxycarotenoid 3,4-desaturase